MMTTAPAEPATPRQPGKQLMDSSLSSPLSPVPSPFSPSLAIRSARRDTASIGQGLLSFASPLQSPSKCSLAAPMRQDMSSSVSRASETFVTALDTPPEPTDTTTTAASTPIDSKQDVQPVTAGYRSARPFPVKLEMKTEIPLEEGVDYAIQFLATILFAAAPPKAAYVPPPKQLALVATYAVHPKYTSHPEETDATRLSAQAIQYLRSVLRTVGPVNSRLDVAFAFREAGDDDLDSHEESEPLHCALARRGSIWQRVSNFWEALGWAFHCAVSYPRRWKHWKAWLELMVEVLEADWEERKKLDEANLYRASPSVSTSQSNTAVDGYPMLRGSILYKYIGDRPMKELLRAVMAFSEGDNPTDRGSFNKVFSRELATEKTAEQKEAKLQKIDLENNVFGDYAIQEASSSEDDDMLEPQASRSRKRRRAETNVNEAPDPIQTALEDRVAETIGTRLKLFELLSQAYCHDQAGDMLYDFYVEFGLRIRQLPLEIFRLFIRSSGTPLEDDVYASVLRYIILTLAPKDTFDNEEGISLAMCERLFVSLSARRSSVEDNAKLALVLEAMLQHIIARNPGEQCSSTFRQAVEMGIAARREKTKPKMRGGRLNKESPNEQAARKILERSETNLRALVDLLEDTD